MFGNAKNGSSDTGKVVFLALLGTYLNAFAYGFKYPLGGDYDFQLPLLNWLRNPSLYPRDPIREAYSRFPTLFWPVVAALSNHFSTGHILFAFFILSKVLFFLAFGGLVTAAVRERLLAACVIAALSLSPLLNASMPFGAGRVLVDVQTHASLGTAMLFLTGILLVFGRWWSAVTLGALSVYVDALPFLHTLPAFALFALLDWRKQKRSICIAATVGAIICVPWLLLSRHSLAVSFPKDYLQGILLFFPFHSTIRFDATSNLLKGAAILGVAGWMCFVARRTRIGRRLRLEALAASYLLVVLLGVVVGEVHLTPDIARLCLPRADAFLIPYAIVLIQIYGANLLSCESGHGPLTDLLLGISAILLPLSIHLVMPFLLLMLVFRVLPRELLGGVWHRISGSITNRQPVVPKEFATALCSVALVLAGLHIVPSAGCLWHFARQPLPGEHGCYEVQQWARTHTALNARFLVPPLCGFRSISERSSWGEWKDGTAAFHYPPFADVFLRREADFGIRPGPNWPDLGFIQENYKRQSWNHLRTIAIQNHLDYIVQFRDVSYPAEPIFADSWYAVYPATQ